jgi:FixJ family two-component response regulator
MIMADSEPVVIVVDDDPSVRTSVGNLLRSVKLDAILLQSVAEFLALERPERPACLVLDVRLPGKSGLELQRDLAESGIIIPTIFMTGYADVPMSVRAMKSGAIEFLTKPVRDQDLLDAIQLGLDRDRAWLAEKTKKAALKARFDCLTPREQEVMALVITGRRNKEIAIELGVAEITVKVHRAQIMRKMHASSLIELARMASRLDPAANEVSAQQPPARLSSGLPDMPRQSAREPTNPAMIRRGAARSRTE